MIPAIGEKVKYYKRKAGGNLHSCELVDALVVEHQKKRPSMMDKIYIRYMNDEPTKKDW